MPAGDLQPGDSGQSASRPLRGPRLFKKEEGAEGHCEAMAPIVFWDAAFNWLDALLQS
jgi:hypothetical protein